MTLTSDEGGRKEARLFWAKKFGVFLRTKESREGVQLGIQQAGRPQHFKSTIAC